MKKRVLIVPRTLLLKRFDHDVEAARSAWPSGQDLAVSRLVLVSVAGLLALLAVSRTGGSRGNSFVSSKPKLCRPGLRASDDDAT
jgi:hypothetical protein